MTHDMSEPGNVTADKTNQNQVAKKFLTTAGALAAISPAALDADVMYIDDRPVSVTMSFSNVEGLWDVDGDGSQDFLLFNLPALGVSSTTNGALFIPLNAGLQSYNYGRGVVGSNTQNMFGLSPGVTVGPTLAGYEWADSSPGFFALKGRAYGFYSMTPNGASTFVISNYGGTEFGANVVNFSEGNNFIGFRFAPGATNVLNYGWAEVNFTGRTMTITRWAYESTGDTAIQVGAGIPEPSSLALLGMGAAGVLAWRKRRKTDAGGDRRTHPVAK